MSKRQPPQISVKFRPPEELSDAAIQRLIDRGRRQGELLEELFDAVRANDQRLAWELCLELLADWERPLPAA
jgi:hypothetical protein